MSTQRPSAANPRRRTRLFTCPLSPGSIRRGPLSWGGLGSAVAVQTLVIQFELDDDAQGPVRTPNGTVPMWFSHQRVFRRSVMRAIDKKPICNGNTESFRAMFGRDSIIGWHFRSFGRKRGRIRSWAAAAEGPAVLLFTGSRDLEVWIDTLGDGAANGTNAPGGRGGRYRRRSIVNDPPTDPTVRKPIRSYRPRA
jgi:hypothetical protein